MTIVKQKSSLNAITVLMIIGFFVFLFFAVTPVKQVKTETVLTLNGNKDQTVYFAPGGENPPSGYKLKKVDTLHPGDQVTVEENNQGTTTVRVLFPFMKNYIRIKTPSGKIGWVALSIFENKNQKTEIYRPGE